MPHNILLINPAVNPESQSKIISAVINTTLPTSMGVLAAYLEKYGDCQARIVDEQIEFLDSKALESAVNGLPEPAIVGLSVLTINAKRAYFLVERIKEIRPGTVVILGGIHPTVLPEEALSKKGVDFIVRGEGEKAIVSLVNAIRCGGDPRAIEGVSYVRDGEIRHNPCAALIENLDEIPPFPYHMFEKHRMNYSTFGSIFTSRGCPYNCIFCSSRSVSGKKYRYFSVDRVISEIRLLIEKYNQPIIWWMDDNIAVDKKRLMSLLDRIIAEGFNKKAVFHGSMRGDNATPEIVVKAKEAGFTMLSFGLETGSERLMKTLCKGETVKQVADAIKMTDSHGVATAATIIFGIPGETSADRRETMAVVDDLPLRSVRFNTLIPYPGTPVFDIATKEHNLLIKKDWKNFAVQYMWEGDDIPYVPLGDNRYNLIFDTMFANLRSYLSLKGIGRMLKSSYAGGNVVALSARWYLSPITVWRLSRVALRMTLRFGTLAIKVKILRLK